MTKEAIDTVEKLTQGQATNSLWLILRKGRVTSSKFGSILKSCARSNFTDSFFKSILGEYNLQGVKAIQWGIDNEDTAANCYRKQFPVLNVEMCGFILHESGVIGASPDRLIGENGILEIKCPFSHRHHSIVEAISLDNKFYVYKNGAGIYMLRKDHDYYHQCQGLLHITNRKFLHFFVYSPKGSLMVNVRKDVSWEPNINILINFYYTVLVPRLMLKCN